MLGFDSIRIYLKEATEDIECVSILKLADEISCCLGVAYTKLGYRLLHPDYDYKDIGKLFDNNNNGRKLFLNTCIPRYYYGHEKIPSAPTLFFETTTKSPIFGFPEYEIALNYNPIRRGNVELMIRVHDVLLKKPISLKSYYEVHSRVMKAGFAIQTSFLHYHLGNMRSMILNGGLCTFMTINEYQIFRHAIDYDLRRDHQVLDVLYMNAITKKMLSEKIVSELKKTVGEGNYIEDGEMFYYRLTGSRSCYLLRMICDFGCRYRVRKILQKEKLCEKDAPLIWYILKL